MSQTNPTASDSRIDEVLQFWLGASPPTDEAALPLRMQWFTKSDAFDEEIRTRFEPLIDEALAGQLDAWAEHATGRLALIVLLDQFTRNIYRGTPRAFAGDARALRLALEGMDRGHDQAICLAARSFCYMPLEHAEDPAMQARCVKAFEALAAQATPQTEALITNGLDYAHQHLAVIAQFGRFPHRNPILGRESTPAERDYLAQPGAGF